MSVEISVWWILVPLILLWLAGWALLALAGPPWPHPDDDE